MKNKFADLMGNVEAENYLIYHENQPIGTGTLILHAKTGGIFNMAILPEYQKKGYGSALTQFLMQRAFELGLKQVVLLSSSDVESFYRRLQFRSCLAIDVYIK